MKKFEFITIGIILIVFSIPNVWGDIFSDADFSDSGVRLENAEIKTFNDERIIRLKENISKNWTQTDWEVDKKGQCSNRLSESMNSFWENVKLLEDISLNSSGSKHIADYVLISELFYDPVGTDRGKEWIELYNPTSDPVDIGNWTIQPWNGSDNKPLKSTTLPAGAIIPSYGFYLIGENEIANADYTVELEFQNGPDSVELQDELGIRVDGLMYGGFVVGGEGNPSIDVSSGCTLERYSSDIREKQCSGNGNGYDTDNNFRDFYQQTSPNPENSSVKVKSPASRFRYKSSGYFVSPVFDAGCSVRWGSLDWTASEPSSTLMRVNKNGKEPLKLIDGENIVGFSKDIIPGDCVDENENYKRIIETGIGQSWLQSKWVEDLNGLSTRVIDGENSENCDTYSFEENLSMGEVIELEKTLVAGKEANVLDDFNQSFESSISLESWEELGTESQITCSSNRAHFGKYSCRFSDLTNSYSGRVIRSNKDNIGEYVFSGENYTVDAWFYVDNDDGGKRIKEINLKIFVEWYDGSWNHLEGQDSVREFFLTSINRWESANFEEITAPPEATYAKLGFAAKEENNKNYDLYIDDVRFFGSVGETGHRPSAYLDSLVYDSGDNDTLWDKVSWSSFVPKQTGVNIFIRFGNSLDESSSLETEWQVCKENPCNFENKRGRYVQYRVVEKTENVFRTPSFESIEIKTMTENNFLRWEQRIDNVQSGWENYILEVRGRTFGDSEEILVEVWNENYDEWERLGEISTDRDTIKKNFSRTEISNRLNGENLSIKYESADDNDFIPTGVCVESCRLIAENEYESSIEVYVRTSSDGEHWTRWEGPCINHSNLGLSDNRYIQYRVELDTEDSSETPSLENLRINYFANPKHGAFVSQPIETGYVSSCSLGWDGGIPSGGFLKFRARSSENENDWSDWSGPMTNRKGSVLPVDMGGKNYLQIKAEISKSDGSNLSPSLNSYKITYDRDTSPPQIENPSRFSVSSEAVISAFLSDESSIEKESIELYLDGIRIWHDYNSQSGKVEIALALEDGFYPLKLKVEDIHGQRVERTWDLTVFTESPAPPTLDDIPRFVGRRNVEVTGNMELESEITTGWDEAPSNPPVGIGDQNGRRMVAMGGKIYFWTAYGGEPGSGGSVKNNFYRYSPLNDSWSQLSDAPFGSAYGIATTLGADNSGENAVYIIGGYWSGQKSKFARYTESDGWENLNHKIPFHQYSEMKQDFPRNGSAIVWDRGDYIYLFPGSGYSYPRQKDWYRYSISSDSWEFMGELPRWNGVGNAATFVEGSAVGESENYIYAVLGMYHFGDPYKGRYNLENENQSGASFIRYGLSSENWKILDNCGPGSDHPYGADDGSALVWDGRDYIYHTPGAYEETVQDTDGEVQKREFMRYSLSEGVWKELESTPFKGNGGWDDGGGIVLVGDKIFGLKGGDDIAWTRGDEVVGGGSVMSNDFWSYSLPKVSRVADNQVLMYVGDNCETVVPVEDNGWFKAEISLGTQGPTRIRARSLDLEGNPSKFSSVQLVRFNPIPSLSEITYPPVGISRLLYGSEFVDAGGGQEDSGATLSDYSSRFRIINHETKTLPAPRSWGKIISVLVGVVISALVVAEFFLNR